MKKSNFIKKITVSFFCLLTALFLSVVYISFPNGNSSSPIKREIASEASMNCLERTKIFFNTAKVNPGDISKKTRSDLLEYFQRIHDEHNVDMTELGDISSSPLQGSNGKYFTIGQKLLENVKNGSIEAQGFMKLGYHTYTHPRITTYDNLPLVVLQSPLSLVDIYTNAYKELFSHIGTSIAESDLILPALIFHRDKKIKLFRPLLDPFPSKSEGWILLRGDAQISNRDFAIAIAEGKMPLEYSMYFHDVGHIAYDIQRPEIMGLRRKYYKKEARILGGANTPAHKEAGNYLNEFLITLRLSSRDKINRLLTPKRITSDDIRIEELMADINEGVFQKRVEEIQNNFHSLFEGHGGGWMDGRSMLIFPDDINEELNKRANHWAFSNETSIGTYLSQSSYWGLVEQLKEGIKKVSFYQKNPTEQNFGHKLADAEETYKKVLATIMLDLEKRSAAGLKYKIDVKQVWEDAGAENFSGTQTYKFFQESNRMKNGNLQENSLEVQLMKSSFSSISN